MSRSEWPELGDLWEDRLGRWIEAEMNKGFVTVPGAQGWKRLSPQEMSSPSLEVCEQGQDGCSVEPSTGYQWCKGGVG